MRLTTYRRRPSTLQNHFRSHTGEKREYNQPELSAMYYSTDEFIRTLRMQPSFVHTLVAAGAFRPSPT